MEQGVTWYEVLGVLPGAEPHRIKREYEARSGLLRPEMIAGAPSNVLTAVTRAQDLLDSAWQVLSDPEAPALLRRGGWPPAHRRGPGRAWVRPQPDRVRPGRPGPGRGTARGCGQRPCWCCSAGGSAGRSGAGRRAVPDVRGLFTGTCREVARRHGLEVTAVRLTERPMPVEGLVVSQDPAPGSPVPRRPADRAGLAPPVP